MKRIAMISGAALVSVLLFKTSYVARESMLGLAALGIVYSAVVPLLAFSFLAFRGAVRACSWLRLLPQHWDDESVERIFALSRPQRRVAEPTPRIPVETFGG